MHSASSRAAARGSRARVLSRPVCAPLAVALVLTMAGCVPQPATPEESPTPPPLWADEFDGPAGSRPDPAAWVTEIGNAERGGWGNAELQYYTDSAENASLDGDGNLVISARPAAEGAELPCFTVPQCPYTSARLTTEGTVSLETGRVEVRARIPNGTGLLPAVWMLGDNGLIWPEQGEIDIAEVVGGEPTTVYGTVHGPGYSNADGIDGTIELDGPSSDAFHVYAVDKQPGSITWSVDGRDFFTLTPDDLPDPEDWVFDQGMHLLLNIAVGGSWPGSPDETTPFPAELVVDYVRFSGDGVVDVDGTADADGVVATQ